MAETRTNQQNNQQSTAIQLTAQERSAIQVCDPEVQREVEQYKAGLNIKDAAIQEYIALALLCRAHNLDAYNQEAYIIPGHGVMVGIKGTRKAAWAQLPAGANYNPNPRMIQFTEYTKYGIHEETPPKGKGWKTGNDGKRYFTWVDNPIVMAFVSELTRSDATDKWIEQAERLTKLTGSYEKAISILGPRPVWIGIGIVRKLDESKMETVQLARKRAESDSSKQAFNLPFAINVEQGADDDIVRAGDTVEGEVVGNGNKPQAQLADVAEAEVVERIAPEPTIDQPAEPEPAPEPQPDPPAVEKPVVKAQPAPAPQVVTGKIPTPEKPKAKAEKKAETKPEATKPARPVDDIDIMALKRCNPSSWVTAVEMLNKTLNIRLTAGMLREKVDQKLGTMFTELNADAWAAAIEVAQSQK